MNHPHSRDTHSGVPRPPACIVPPHMLESIAANGTHEQRTQAQRTLEQDEHARQVRRQQPRARRRRDVRPPTPPRSRAIYDAQHGTDLPGTPMRSEGEAASADVAVNEAYDGLGVTWQLYWDAFERNSYDDRGAELVGSVHYSHGYDNAYWDGTQLVFGDGDGRQFNRFTKAVDVIGHELTHAVTGAESQLEYQGQPGALNESLSDCFGSLVKQYAQTPKPAADEADWLIGAELLTDQVHGVALRSMKAPGTAYDDPVLGKDPQPAHMRDFVDTTKDNGGVHINSGIPNHAFYLFATGLGGHAWRQAGQVWYAAATDEELAPDSDFEAFAAVTAAHALARYDASVRQACVDAWAGVGVTLPDADPVGGPVGARGR
ncbi:MAG: M4 family metallopeptidase [Nocardioidaceae bacterium]